MPAAQLPRVGPSGAGLLSPSICLHAGALAIAGGHLPLRPASCCAQGSSAGSQADRRAAALALLTGTAPVSITVLGTVRETCVTTPLLHLGLRFLRRKPL